MSDTRPSLLAGLRSETEEAYERLYRIYGPSVLAWCRGAGLSHQDAEDVRQEVFLIVRQQFATFRRDQPGDSFGGWLYGITRNCVYQQFDDRQFRGAGGSDAAFRMGQYPDEPDFGAEPAEDRAARLDRALEEVRPCVSDRDWRVLFLATHGRLKNEEIALEMGLEKDNVRQILHRLFKKVRKELGEPDAVEIAEV